MPLSNIINSLCFDIAVGNLMSSQGDIPTYLRFSPANAGTDVNGSWRTFGAGVHEPRSSSTGSILLEAGAVNLVTHALDLTRSVWVKGGNISVAADRWPAMDGNQLADQVTVAAYAGNDAANTMSRSFSAMSGRSLICTVYLMLLGGQFGSSDVIRITGNVAGGTQQVLLGPILNARRGNYIPIQIPFTISGTLYAGSAHPSSTDEGTLQSYSLELYCRSVVSLAWGGAQIESGSVWTSFISPSPDGNVQSRDRDFLEYPKSKIEGLSSFTYYCGLDYWRGDGNILTAGNFKVEIVNSRLQVSCGAVTVTDPDVLPSTNPKIAVRVSQGLSRVAIYVNGVMKATQTLSSYTANSAVMSVCGDGVRQFRCMYLFNTDLSDGSINTGQTVLGDMLILHQQDNLLVDLAEGYSRIILPPITIPAGGEVAIRYPQFQRAAQSIATLTPGGGAVAQVERVTARTIVNAAAAQTDTVTINQINYPFTSDATPTLAEVAAGLANLIGALPKQVPVSVAYTPGNTFFDLTADVAGDDFSLSVSANLSRGNTASSAVTTNTMTVPAASDFVVGAAHIYRNYAFICDVIIDSINTLTNTITFRTRVQSDLSLIQVGDVLLQPSWSLRIGQSNSFVHHLEDFSDVRISLKSIDGARFRNQGQQVRRITPYFKVTI